MICITHIRVVAIDCKLAIGVTCHAFMAFSCHSVPLCTSLQLKRACCQAMTPLQNREGRGRHANQQRRPKSPSTASTDGGRKHAYQQRRPNSINRSKRGLRRRRAPHTGDSPTPILACPKPDHSTARSVIVPCSMQLVFQRSKRVIQHSSNTSLIF